MGAFDLGHTTADIMLESGMHLNMPDENDVRRYAYVAAAALSIPNGNHWEKWTKSYIEGYMDRLAYHIVLEGDIIIQRWVSNTSVFGVAHAPDIYHLGFAAVGGRREPAHYGLTHLHEHFVKDSWILPIGAYDKIYALLAKLPLEG